MRKAETHLQQVDRQICKAEWRITGRGVLIAMPEQGGWTASLSCAHDVSTALLTSLDAFWARRRAVLLRGIDRGAANILRTAVLCRRHEIAGALPPIATRPRRISVRGARGRDRQDAAERYLRPHAPGLGSVGGGRPAFLAEQPRGPRSAGTAYR